LLAPPSFSDEEPQIIFRDGPSRGSTHHKCLSKQNSPARPAPFQDHQETPPEIQYAKTVRPAPVPRNKPTILAPVTRSGDQEDRTSMPTAIRPPAMSRPRLE